MTWQANRFLGECAQLAAAVGAGRADRAGRAAGGESAWEPSSGMPLTRRRSQAKPRGLLLLRPFSPAPPAAGPGGISAGLGARAWTPLVLTPDAIGSPPAAGRPSLGSADRGRRAERRREAAAAADARDPTAGSGGGSGRRAGERPPPARYFSEAEDEGSCSNGAEGGGCGGYSPPAGAAAGKWVAVQDCNGRVRPPLCCRLCAAVSVLLPPLC
jgi:hypothetical protein